MREKDKFPFTSKKVFRIEHERELGHNVTASIAVKPVLDFPLDDFVELSEERKKLFMMASRIGMVTEMSLANQAWKAPTVAEHLAEARRFIALYNYPAVSQAAAEIKTDTEDNPYEFISEMRRDEIAYSLSVAGLVGDSRVIDYAINQMQQLVEESTEPTSKTLSEFYLARMMHRQNPSVTNFRYLRRTYKDAVRASKEINRWERVATVAAGFTVDSLRYRHPSDALKGGIVNLQSALVDLVTAKVLPKELYKVATESLRHRIWRATVPSGVDYSYLQLS